MIGINLAPRSKTKQAPDIGSRAGISLGLVFGALFLALVGGLSAYGWKVSADMSRIEREIARAEKDKARLHALIAEGQRFKREKEELERRVNGIESVARSQVRPAYLMDAMADLVPADVWLTRVEEKGRHLRLAGAASSAVALSDFMDNLKASDKFRDVDLVESRQDLTKPSRTITFELSCRFEI